MAPDVVSLRVQGADCSTDLTLLDLPGIVRSSAQDESERLPTDIQNSMQDYLKNTRSIILAVHAASSDFHNSQIMAEAIHVDPNTTRTIPVLTKPDLIDPGAEESVVDLLLGEKLNFAMGFHMVKGRGQAALEREASIEDGLDDEMRFFNEKEPWKSIQDRSYFGTTQLRQKLGALQMSMIRQSLPGIIAEIRERQQRAKATLDELGELHDTTSDRRCHYQSLCQNLASQLKSSLSGKGSGARKPSAAASLHQACNEFMKSIRKGSLATVRSVVEGAQVLVTSPRGDISGEVVHLDEVFACVDCVREGDSQSETLFESVGIHSETPIEENDVWSDGCKVYIARKNNTYDTLKKVPLASIRTDPTWLKDKISESRTDELACFLNIDMFKSLIEEFIDEDWRPHCAELLDTTEDIVLHAVRNAIQTTLSSNRYPALTGLIQKQCHAAAQDLLGLPKSRSNRTYN